MKKIIVLQSLFLSLFAGSSQAAETSCEDNLKRDRSINYQQCALSKTVSEEMTQVDLSRFAVSNNILSLTASQTVLCSQCHQSSMPMRQLNGSTPPHGKNMQATSR